MKAGSCALHPPARATCNAVPAGATGAATPIMASGRASPMTGRDLRAQLKMQQARNRRSARGESTTPAGAGDATAGTRVPINKPANSAGELRDLVGIIAADWPDDERAEAMAAALAEPEAALVCFRTLAEQRRKTVVINEKQWDAGRQVVALTPSGGKESRVCVASAEMRPCVDCANFTPSGRCLAAWRGESFGAGIATSRTWTPVMPEQPQRCGAYAPGPNDSDARTGRERWPFLFATEAGR